MGNGSILMALDGQGNLNAAKAMITGTMYTTDIQAVGNVLVYGTTTTGALVMGPWSFYNNGDQIQQHTAGWYEQWRSSDGLRLWVGGNVTQMSLDGGGSLAVTGNITGAYLYYPRCRARQIFVRRQPEHLHRPERCIARPPVTRATGTGNGRTTAAISPGMCITAACGRCGSSVPAICFATTRAAMSVGTNVRYLSDERTKTDIRLTSGRSGRHHQDRADCLPSS